MAEKEIGLLEQIVKPVLTRILDWIAKGDHWLAYIFLLVTVGFVLAIGFLIGWIITKRKTAAEIKLLQEDIKSKKLTGLEKLKSSRNKYLEDSNLFQIALGELVEATTQQNEVSLGSKWDETRNFFFNHFVNSFEEYIEYCEVLNEGNGYKIQDFIFDEIIPFLDMMKAFKNTMNIPTILEKANRASIEINAATLNTTLKYANRNISKFRIPTLLKLMKLKKSILN
ncbi:hypothetical protein LEP1GSC050_0525 [Leptospira broomii serovar Hurstbridge str. 5399]|uniref:Uncharacterized protein n=1 Tax=Leptospira broomii serovar Hurstbridge str. 5399 TaxID=1049789 RepID=T0FGD0_9LEPT|nr:hypothetical protein [Leptospira broomii]EQA46647.1 hypothetical protein LEP1GSC050_0525 [Leptospira broomii serovar Hurstbridge str. 5399]